MASLSWLSILLLVNGIVTVKTNNSYYHCYSTGNFSHESAYGNYRDSFLYSMPNNIISQGGYDFSHSAMTTSPAAADLYCLGLCRNDIMSSTACSDCISKSAFAITTHCPVELEVISWGHDADCIVRCSPHQFPSMFESQPVIHTCNDSSVSVGDLSRFKQALDGLIYSVAERAGGNGSWSSSSSEFYVRKYFATGESNQSVDGQTIYVVGFCLPTLFQTSCSACLHAAGNESHRQCKGKIGATVFTPSCVLRYELYRFYQSDVVPPIPAPPPSSPSAVSTSRIRKEGRYRMVLAISILAPVIALLTVVMVLRYILVKKQKHNGANEAGAKSMDSFLEFSLKAIKEATNDFSISNKLGRGGFGEVYKGILANGHQIAVKRLSHYSTRGDNEFRNEVQLVAKLHHKNLIKLIGFCLGKTERILIYELALNGSLDHFLFDPIRREHLNWEVRYGIIEGIARGMVYLHEESQLRIIHRDLKASNVLLDESMTPKISDFGTARLFIQDKDSASKIVGTYGYMAPEYAKHGKMSIKIDVFSFGVLLLEIISGQKNTSSEHLLSKAWSYWVAGKHEEMIDPVLRRSNDGIYAITRCMHIGLLCVQEDAQIRPTMNSVIMMLEDGSQEVLTPMKPAYFMAIKSNQTYESSMHQGYRSRSLSSYSSVNEISITQYPDPR